MARVRAFCVCCALLPVVSIVPMLPGAEQSRPAVNFNRAIQPLLSKNCFACHGPDEEHREAGLRLDQREVAVQELESGAVAIVPGNPSASELVRRITSTDESLRMPPADSGHELSPDQIETLKHWIAQGADYTPHWSYVKPQRPMLPSVQNPEWPRNAMDYFILAKLEAAGLAPMPQADRHTLIRRLSLDLRGLPPSPEEVAAFVSDPSPNAYEQLVDRFLADPGFGERWARMWLDLARYADSSGFGSDPLRLNVWRYRDWVIGALNNNMPYDQFTIEQLAGDLLPNPTLEQRMATAFHRNTMTNTEGGTDDEEFRVAAVKDRVDTTFQVWMGLTMGCAKCHSHKFDPISQREYYEAFALFNQTADRDLPTEEPTVPAPTPRMVVLAERIDAKIAELKRQLDTPTPELADAQRHWEEQLRAATNQSTQGRFVRVELPGRNKILSLAEVQAFDGDTNLAPTGKAKQSSTAFEGPAAFAIDGKTDGEFSAKSTTHTNQEKDPWWELDLGGMKPIQRIALWNRTDNGLHTRLANFRVLVLDESRQPVYRKEMADAPNPNIELKLEGPRSAVPADLLAVIDSSPDSRTPEQRTKLAAYYRTIAPLLNPVREQIAKLEKSKPTFPALPIMQELPPDKHRETHLMLKGNFLTKGEKVEPGVPAAFHPLRPGVPPNRLGLAQWLVDPENPLTARVAVNRFWSQLFGLGLVETEEDFGLQGDLPSHPALLDWLAVEFVGPEVRDQRSEVSLDCLAATRQRSESPDPGPRTPDNWDIKHLLRLIVTSATYRQSSRVTPEALEKDPRNRLLSRGPRYRLEAELVRDQALALSGLLSRKIGGPSVYPVQPDGLWRAAFNGQRTWATSQGEDKYRRGLYTFWRRTVPYPSMATFDAPSREICTVRRIRTNTPLQAFVTLNDPVYVELAQALAARILREGGQTTDERAAYGLSLCLCRSPQPEQVAELVALYQEELDHYRGQPDAAAKLAGGVMRAVSGDIPPAEVAAWTVVANVLLNLDGVVTKN